jgi:hypothetical protein
MDVLLPSHDQGDAPDSTPFHGDRQNKESLIQRGSASDRPTSFQDHRLLSSSQGMRSSTPRPRGPRVPTL